MAIVRPNRVDLYAFEVLGSVELSHADPLTLSPLQGLAGDELLPKAPRFFRWFALSENQYLKIGFSP